MNCDNKTCNPIYYVISNGTMIFTYKIFKAKLLVKEKIRNISI